MSDKTFVGFGFGAIQAGLFLYEAHRSGNFSRFVVAEVIQDVVDAMRKNNGAYHLNVATQDSILDHEVPHIEILNPRVAEDRKTLIEAVSEASEIATALPSVKFYGTGQEDDVVGILAAGLERKTESATPTETIIYTAENNNHAAEILHKSLLACASNSDATRHSQCLNTVIGKMSGVVTDKDRLQEQNLAPVTPGIDRAFLVEEFNRILVTRIQWPDFVRGITVFEEKDDLLPFEEAKLYGHNATHALIGYLLRQQKRTFMAEARNDKRLMDLARDAFVTESGGALCRKYAGVDPLFTETGYTTYIDELLERMLNPHLRDTVERITRDPWRKLGWNDRLVGTMRVALQQHIIPHCYARGAKAALHAVQEEDHRPAVEILDNIWNDDDPDEGEKREIQKLVLA